jgi:hypothetical protein
MGNDRNPRGFKNVNTSNPNSENVEMSSSVEDNEIFVGEGSTSQPLLNVIDFLLGGISHTRNDEY